MLADRNFAARDLLAAVADTGADLLSTRQHRNDTHRSAPSQDRSAPDPLLVKVWAGMIGSWRVKPQRSMRAPPVVVGAELGEDGAQMSLAEDQGAVGGLGSGGFFGRWVPETLHPSGDLLILVEQSADSVVSSYVMDLGGCRVREWT